MLRMTVDTPDKKELIKQMLESSGGDLRQADKDAELKLVGDASQKLDSVRRELESLARGGSEAAKAALGSLPASVTSAADVGRANELSDKGQLVVNEVEGQKITEALSGGIGAIVGIEAVKEAAQGLTGLLSEGTTMVQNLAANLLGTGIQKQVVGNEQGQGQDQGLV